jgi:dipeptide/tripeptide permease
LGLILSAVATPANGAPAWVAVPSLALTGLGSIGYLTTANTAVQMRVPDALVGRVMGLWVVVNAGTAPLGSLVLGGATERFGLPPVLLASGVVGLLIGAYVGAPGVRKVARTLL